MQVAMPTNATYETSKSSYQKISLDNIDVHPRQARQVFDNSKIASLAHSLEESGLIEPILLRSMPGGRYELVAGERRYRAATMAGWTDIPAIVRELDDKDSLELMMIENIHRRDFDPIETARGLTQLCRPVAMGGGGKSHRECDEMFGKGQGWCNRTLNLLKLPKSWQDRIRSRELKVTTAQALIPFAEQPKVLATIEKDMKKNPWAWRSREEVTRSARMISDRLQAVADRKAAKAAAKPGQNGATTEAPDDSSSRPGRPRVKNVRKQPACYRDEIKRILFHVRSEVGDWPEGEILPLCESLHNLADDLAGSVEEEDVRAITRELIDEFTAGK